MPEPTKPSAAVLKKYFGTKPGQTLVDFKNEYSELSEEDKVQLTRGISDGSLTY